jgi:RHS repeat-associated protein
VEKDLYFFHADHLGSSHYITDTQGQLFEHLEYFPFGETWVEESTNTQRTPYLFTGMELDEETGLYYLGARYYDPRTSVFQSVDPIISSYLDGRPNGGVYKSINVNLYRYAALNPLKYADPTGAFDASSPEAAKLLEEAAQTTRKPVFTWRSLGRAAGWSLLIGAILELGGDTRQPSVDDVYEQIAAATKKSPLSQEEITDTLGQMNTEMARLGQKDEGPRGYQYSLRAQSDGDYIDYHSATGKIALKAHNVWKYGESTQPDDPGRYPGRQLEDAGLYMLKEFYGTQREIKQMEKAKIYLYIITHGRKPPGNKLTR